MATRTNKEYSDQDKIQQTDHDSLIRLEGKVDQVLTGMEELKNGTASRLESLEKRVKRFEDLETRLWGIFISVSAAIALFGFYIRGFIEDLYKHVYGH